MPNSKERLTIRELQDFARRLEAARGFTDESPLEKCLLLGEEVGELFKAVRQRTGIKTDVQTGTLSVADELADVLLFVLTIANRFDIDLEEAVMHKKAKDGARVWR
ncbi:MAG: MazG nucleotide pyrophosphohydrolase domain-containing protein [Rhodospirillaceae bacterium]